MEQPLVSVVIATNRAGQYLRDALASVRTQTYPNWEVVIVDDGGPDPEALDAMAAGVDGVRVLHQDNAGVSAARNAGIGVCRGQWCAFLDDDDIWMPSRLQRQVEALARTPDAVLAYGRVSSMDAEGRLIAPADQLPTRDLHDLFSRERVPQFQTVTVRRNALVQIGGFHAAFRFAEDLDVILRLARIGSFVFVDEEVARYRLHAGNVTRDNRALAGGIATVLRMHRHDPRARHDGTARDLRIGLRRNRMFAAWTAARAIAGDLRARRYRHALSETAWILRFAPDAPAVYLWRRLRIVLRGSDGGRH